MFDVASVVRYGKDRAPENKIEGGALGEKKTNPEISLV